MSTRSVWDTVMVPPTRSTLSTAPPGMFMAAARVGGSPMARTEYGGLRIWLSICSAPGAPITQEGLEKEIWNQLRTCYDPEIPVNIVDLGLIYDCHLTPLGANSYKADVKMTLTAPGCGMGPMLPQDVQNKLLSLEGVDDVAVELVWDPPWHQSMMSEAAKLQLGLL